MANIHFSRQERITTAAKKSSIFVERVNCSTKECVRVSDLTQIHHMRPLEKGSRTICVCKRRITIWSVTGPAALMKLFFPSWTYVFRVNNWNTLPGRNYFSRGSVVSCKTGEGARDWQKTFTLAEG
ncbi:hypothetical protein HAV15_002952 [Penicillium sp. str. |nr:hypothetical protein HAV15_002952 [Penicillium sp. str. \